MAFTTYTTFVATVANYLGRDDLTSVIPDFVELGQHRMTRDLRVQEMLKSATANTSAGDSTVAFPSDMLELRDIHIQGSPNYTVEYQTPAAFYANNLTHTSGVPTKFTMLGQEFQFAPVPDGTQTLQILYYAKPTYISSSNATNVFLANFPDALLYATLAEAEPYLVNDERIQTWATLYDRAIANIKANDKGATYPNKTLNVTTD